MEELTLNKEELLQLLMALNKEGFIVKENWGNDLALLIKNDKRLYISKYYMALHIKNANIEYYYTTNNIDRIINKLYYMSSTLNNLVL